jgi:hypothetical protein
MDEDRLNSLSLLAIATESVNKIKFDDVVDYFAAQKSRRKPLSVYLDQ